MTIDDARALYRALVETETGCWVWCGAISNGYGFHTPFGEYSHTYIYRRLVGPIPQGLVLDHLCRNRLCVNPAHLQPVSRAENTLRGVGPTAANARKTHCPRGHPYDAANTIVRPGGGRRCRVCNNANVWRRKRAGED